MSWLFVEEVDLILVGVLKIFMAVMWLFSAVYFTYDSHLTADTFCMSRSPYFLGIERVI
jgi:hypothetical protein